MPSVSTADKASFREGPSIRQTLTNGYQWLATWAERNVEPDAEGQHVPDSVRRILENRTYYL